MKAARKQMLTLLMVWITGMIVMHLSLSYQFLPGIVIGGVITIWLPLALILRITLVRVSDWLGRDD
jgi:hypothetical protein